VNEMAAPHTFPVGSSEKKNSQWPHQLGSHVLELRTAMEMFVKFSGLLPPLD